jgi:hypothetical protein
MRFDGCLRPNKPQREGASARPWTALYTEQEAFQPAKELFRTVQRLRASPPPYQSASLRIQPDPVGSDRSISVPEMIFPTVRAPQVFHFFPDSFYY